MRSFSQIMLLATVAFAPMAGAAPVSKDTLTQLPLDPATNGIFGGAMQPTKIPDMQYCKSKISTDFYPLIADEKMEATVAWYTANLQGFKHTHGYAAGRTRDTFYSADGTELVVVTADPAQEGASAKAHGIQYLKVIPGLSEKTIVAMNIEKTVCF
jgi:hypothetical protein